MTDGESENPPEVEDFQKNMDNDNLDIDSEDIIQSPSVSVKKSRINKLFEILVPYRSDDAGNHWCQCPFCGSPNQFSFHVEKYVFWCWGCRRGRHQTLKDLMQYLRID